MFSLDSFKAGLNDDKPQAAKALSGLEAAKPVRPSLCVRALLMTGRGALTGLLARTRPEVVLAAGGQGCASVFSVEESISKDSRPYRDERKDTVRGAPEHSKGPTLCWHVELSMHSHRSARFSEAACKETAH